MCYRQIDELLILVVKVVVLSLNWAHSTRSVCFNCSRVLGTFLCTPRALIIDKDFMDHPNHLHICSVKYPLWKIPLWNSVISLLPDIFIMCTYNKISYTKHSVLHLILTIHRVTAQPWTAPALCYKTPTTVNQQFCPRPPHGSRPGASFIKLAYAKNSSYTKKKKICFT